MTQVTRLEKTSLRKAAGRSLRRARLGLLLATVASAAALGAGCMQNKGNTGTGTASGTPSDNAAGSNAPAGTVVQIDSYAFKPATLEVKPGTTVIWKNKDADNHTVTSDGEQGGPLDGTVKASGGTYTHTFNSPGEYPYHCNFHPGMKGKVVVSGS